MDRGNGKKVLLMDIILNKETYLDTLEDKFLP